MNTGIGSFICFVLESLINLWLLCLIIWAVLSWLQALDVINTRSRFVVQLERFLDAVVNPVLAPFRRFIRPINGLDLTPIIAFIVVKGVQMFLIPALVCNPLRALLG